MNIIDKVQAYLITVPELQDKVSKLTPSAYQKLEEHLYDKAMKEAPEGARGVAIDDPDVFGWATEWVQNYDPNAKEETVMDKPLKERVEEIKNTPTPKNVEKQEKPAAKELHKEDGTKADQINIFGRFE